MATVKKTDSGKNSKLKKETPGMEFNAKLALFLKENLISVILFVALIVSSIWFTAKIKNNSNHFENVKAQIISKYETELDSLQVKHMEFAATVFSWSVRSELIRNNTENLNQLLTVFVQESKADLVQIITPEDKMVLLSSDKKYEGLQYSGNLDFELNNNSVVLKENNIVKIIIPVMGFNSLIGILILETREI